MKNKAKAKALDEVMGYASKLMAERMKKRKGKKPVAMSVSVETATPKGESESDGDLEVAQPVPMASKDDRKKKLRKAVGLA